MFGPQISDFISGSTTTFYLNCYRITDEVRNLRTKRMKIKRFQTNPRELKIICYNLVNVYCVLKNCVDVKLNFGCSSGQFLLP